MPVLIGVFDMFNCSCCGTEVTSPYFYNGGVYGWTCIKKVNPNAKRNKAKLKVHGVKFIKIIWRTPNSNLDGYGQAIVEINSEKRRITLNKKLSDCGSYYLDEFDISGGFKFYNDKWWVFI